MCRVLQDLLVSGSIKYIFFVEVCFCYFKEQFETLTPGGQHVKTRPSTSVRWGSQHEGRGPQRGHRIISGGRLDRWCHFFRTDFIQCFMGIKVNKSEDGNNMSAVLLLWFLSVLSHTCSAFLPGSFLVLVLLEVSSCIFSPQSPPAC